MSSRRPYSARNAQSHVTGLPRERAAGVAGAFGGVAGHLCYSLIPISILSALSAISQHNWLDRLPPSEHQGLTVWIWSCPAEQNVAIALTRFTDGLERSARRLGREMGRRAVRAGRYR